MAQLSPRSVRNTLLPALLLAPLLAPIAGATPTRAQGVDGTLTGGIADSPRYLRFTNEIGFAERRVPPKLTLSIGGISTGAVMDTGSTGVVVSLAGMFPNWRTDPQIVAAVDALLPPGSNSSVDQPIDTTRLDKSRMKSITYSSSGRILYGIYLDRAITVSGAAATRGGDVRSVTSAKVPVLVVIDEECVSNARNCTPNHQPTAIGMVGIGFARTAPGDQYGTRTLNPFLNLETPSAANGYIITRDGVKIGLDSNDLATRSSTLVVLGRNTAMPGEWLPQQASITVDGRPAVQGNMLLDTGINTMLMTVPSATSAGLRIAPPPSDPTAKPSTDSTLPGGTRIGIALAGASGLPVGYTFEVGRTGGSAPKSLTLVANNGSRADWKATYVNTGVRMLNGFDYIFDDTDGLLGFAPRRPDAS